MNEEIVINEFQDELKGFIRSKVKDYDAANDILQDTLLKIYMNFSTVKNRQSLTSWIYQVTRNTITDYYRKQKLNSEISDDLKMEEDDFDNTKGRRLSNCLKPFINQLPDKYRDALMMVYFEDLSQKEYAGRSGLSYSGAKSNVQRARIKLKEIFEKCCRIEADKYGQIIDYKPKCCN
jgi:RNA polymerase sigma-70 factor, ECF subfamily